MAERLTIQIKDNDNVVVAVHDLPAGTKTESGVVTRDPIPQAHKIALVDIPAGGEVIRYGVVLGYAKNDIPAGSWINEHMLDLPESPALTDMPWGTDIKTPDQLPTPPRTTWMGLPQQGGSCRHPQSAGYRHHCAVRCRRGEGGSGAHQKGATAQVPQCGRRGCHHSSLWLRRCHQRSAGIPSPSVPSPM